jgi:hypothetical protein
LNQDPDDLSRDPKEHEESCEFFGFFLRHDPPPLVVCF